MSVTNLLSFVQPIFHLLDTKMPTMLVLLLVVVIGAAVLAPFLYIAITWDHDVVCVYVSLLPLYSRSLYYLSPSGSHCARTHVATRRFGALPAPNDFGTREFVWRCWLSSLTRVGWRKTVLRSACPHIALQCPFELLSTDFAKFTTSLGFQTLALEKLPFVFPQVATSSMLLQLLGNSNFPTSVRDMRVKALTITQLRPLDMRFRDKATQQDDGAQQPQEIKVRLFAHTYFSMWIYLSYTNYHVVLSA